jgi:hypothetical protein
LINIDAFLIKNTTILKWKLIVLFPNDRLGSVGDHRLAELLNSGVSMALPQELKLKIGC